MPVYAYRWADGSVSVCNAGNKEEAAYLFDEVGPVSRKLIIRLKAKILITARLDVDDGWVFDEDSAFGEELIVEIPRKCYPHYREVFGKIVDNDSGWSAAEGKRNLIAALKKDYSEAAARIRRTIHIPDEFSLNPRGFPGQNN